MSSNVECQGTIDEPGAVMSFGAVHESDFEEKIPEVCKKLRDIARRSIENIEIGAFQVQERFERLDAPAIGSLLDRFNMSGSRDMNDNSPKSEHDGEAASEQAQPQTLTMPAMEQEQRRLQVERDAKESGAGAKDPHEAVNQDG